MGKKPRIYTEEEKQYLRDIALGKSWAEIQILFNEKFNDDVPVKNIGSALKRYGINTGRNGRFVKGQKAWNEGMKGLQTGGSAGWFKKGQEPINHREVGSERINVDGYIEIKVAEPSAWKLKHRYIWEQVNGEVPKGHCLIFIDNNPLNVTIDNLKLITRRQLLVLNRNKLNYDSPEIIDTTLNLVNLIINIQEKKTALKDK